MALKPEQVTELNIANKRVTEGLGKEKDKANLDFAIKEKGFQPAPLSVKQDTTALADVVDKAKISPSGEWAGYDAAMASEKVKLTNSKGQTVEVSRADYNTNPAYKTGEWKEASAATETPSGTDWIQDWMKSAFGETGVKEVSTPTFSDERTRLETAKANRIAALDTTYATDLSTLRQSSRNFGNSIKARLIKLGVSPSDSSWSSAEAGQLQREQEAEAKLRSEYLSNKAKIESDVDAQLTNIALNEATMKFNATVKNIENKLQTQAQGINLYQIFSQRDQAEKDREQKAYGDMLQYQGTMATLDQKKQEAISKTFLENAQNGLYNVADKTTLEMLLKLEKESPYLTGLTEVATNGLSDRLDKKAQAAADLEKTKSDIAQNYAQINKLRSEASGSGSKELKAFYDDAAAQLNLLASGKTDWATAYSTMKTKYPAADAAQGVEQDKLIDTLLNKNVWSKQGAYETIQAGRVKVDPTLSVLEKIQANTANQ